jgi:hypothetical protein
VLRSANKFRKCRTGSSNIMFLWPATRKVCNVHSWPRVNEAQVQGIFKSPRVIHGYWLVLCSCRVFSMVHDSVSPVTSCLGTHMGRASPALSADASPSSFDSESDCQVLANLQTHYPLAQHPKPPRPWPLLTARVAAIKLSLPIATWKIYTFFSLSNVIIFMCTHA